MTGTIRFYLLISLLAALLHLSIAQEFIQPPASGGINTDPASYNVGKDIKLKWNCDFDTVNVYLWKDQTDSNGNHWSTQLLDKEQNPGEYTYKPDDHVPLDHDTKFHFQVVEVDANSGDETDNSFDSASFDIKSDKTPTTLTKTITSTDAQHHKHIMTMTTVVSGAAATSTAAATSSAAASSTAASTPTNSPKPDNGIFPANMSTGTTIGIGVAFASFVLIVAAVVTLWIRHRNKRVLTKYEEEEKRLSSWPSDVQEPLPEDPRKFRHTLWAPEYRGEPQWSPLPSPLASHPRMSAPEPRRLKLNGLSQKSLPPLPRE